MIGTEGEKIENEINHLKSRFHPRSEQSSSASSAIDNLCANRVAKN